MNYLKLFGIAAFAIGAILYLASSDEHKVVMGNQNYDLGEYVKISVNSPTSLTIRSGEDYGLNVKADERDLKNLRIYVKGQTLVIENRDNAFNIWFGDRPEIRISLPLLKKFTLNSSSDAAIEGIHGRSFKVMNNGSGSISFKGTSDELNAVINGSGNLTSRSYDVTESGICINGSGDVSIAGKCGILEIEINGSGDVSGRGFKCKKVEVDIIGSGDLDIYASEALDVDIMGSGHVNVYGNPKYIKDRSGKKNHITMR